MILALTRLLPSPDQSQQHLIMKGILHCIVHNNNDNAKEKILSAVNPIKHEGRGGIKLTQAFFIRLFLKWPT